MSTRIASIALLAGLVGAPAVALADQAPVAAEVQHTTAPAPASQAQSSSYAQREAQDKKAADFQGGDVVVVMSAGALVVVLVLLILLL